MVQGSVEEGAGREGGLRAVEGGLRGTGQSRGAGQSRGVGSQGSKLTGGSKGEEAIQGYPGKPGQSVVAASVIGSSIQTGDLAAVGVSWGAACISMVAGKSEGGGSSSLPGRTVGHESAFISVATGKSEGGGSSSSSGRTVGHEAACDSVMKALCPAGGIL